MDTDGLVGIAGLGLVAVNFWTSEQRQIVGGTLWGDHSVKQPDAHRALLGIGAELLLVFLLWLFAGASDNWAKAMLAFVVGLWLLWGINHYSHTGNRSAPMPSAPRSPTAPVTA